LSTAGWTVRHLRGPAGALHDRALGPGVGRGVDVLEVDRPALVLGSTQPATIADALALEAFDVELARRRSGGGAVLLVPGQTLWVDVEIPRSDPLWDDDVGRAFHWVGHAWADALATFGVDASVHTGGALETPWSRAVCFGGVGAGEVLVDGRKLVGLSQRRTREGARFQCLLHHRWDPVPILGLLALSHRERAAALQGLANAGAGLDVADDELVRALIWVLTEKIS
jgi:lipoate-protein ligase A